MVPCSPRGMTAEEVEQRCVEARRRFYSLSSIFRRSLTMSQRPRMVHVEPLLPINLLFRSEVMQGEISPG